MKKVIFLGLIFSVLRCEAQYKSYAGKQTKITTMAKLYNKSFDEIQVNGKANFILPNGNSVSQRISGDTYIEDIKIKDTPFMIQNVYSKSNGAIQSSVETFYNFPIGIRKLYGGNGNVINEIDCDKPFQFSIDDLALKIKNEFNIDIMKENKYVDISRTLLLRDSTPLEYQVSFPTNQNAEFLYGDRRVILVDGNDGKILSDTIRVQNK